MGLFKWQVEHMLKKRNRIVASIRKWQTRYLKKIHKFGIELPKTAEQAYALDAKNGNTLWVDALYKELENVRVAFNVLPDENKAPTDHQFLHHHMAFNMKMKDFKHKARFVTAVNMSEALLPLCMAVLYQERQSE